MFKQTTNRAKHMNQLIHLQLLQRLFPGPHFVAVNNKNEIIVTDFHNHSVKVRKKRKCHGGCNSHCSACTRRRRENSLASCFQVYSADGEFLFKFGSHGEGNGQFNAPTGVAVDVNGNIIVADWGNSRIQVRGRFRSFYAAVQSKKTTAHKTRQTLYCLSLCVSSIRCLTAQDPSYPTSTRLQTHCTAPRASPSPQTDTWPLQTLAITASKFTDICSKVRDGIVTNYWLKKQCLILLVDIELQRGCTIYRGHMSKVVSFSFCLYIP